MSSRNSAVDHKTLLQSWQSVAKIIDHTALKPEAAPNQIVQLCQDARQCGFGAVMINPCYVAVASEQLQGSKVKVGSVIAFPFGATLTRVKVFEAEEAMK